MNNRKRSKEIPEWAIWSVCSIHLLSITTISIYQELNPWIPATMVGFFVLLWSAVLTGYSTRTVRAYMESVVTLIAFLVYSFFCEDVVQIMPNFIALVVLLGLYRIPGLFIPMYLATFVLFFNHYVYSGRLSGLDTMGRLVEIFQMINVLFIEVIVCVWVQKSRSKDRKNDEVLAEIEAAEKTKDDFLANVSHEIRTPVNTICGMSDLALRDSNIDSVKEKLWDIRTAGRNLISIVSDILDFSELQSGKVELQEETYNITSTVNDIINMVSAKKADKKIELIVNVDPNIPSSLYGDEKKIRRVVLNLMDNAVKFTENGSIFLDVSFRNEDYGINLIISVKDSGIGMSEEEVEGLFDSFNQADATRKRKEGGMGLGLAISKAIINRMNGTISVKSELGKGSIFKAVIPQKVLDETPIVSINKPEKVNVAMYFNFILEDRSDARDDYMAVMNKMRQALPVKSHNCMNIQELKRRNEREQFSHILTGFNEYMENRDYFDNLDPNIVFAVLIDPKNDSKVTNPAIYKVYTPFYILSIANLLNTTGYDRKKPSEKNGKFTAPDVKVLIVDDNLMNIRVIEGLLAPYKMRLTSVTSGAEAIKAVESRDYDLVFMDHMMPEMDGVEALHHIREKGGDYFKNLKIVALTANAIAGTREMFLREGFDDFVEKPVEPNVLERALKRVLPDAKMYFNETEKVEKQPVPIEVPKATFVSDKKAEPVAVHEEKVHEEEKAPASSISASAPDELVIGDLDTKKGIMYCGGKEQYLEILKMQVDDAKKQEDYVTSLFKEENWKDYTIQVHAIKSTMMSIGAVNLSEMAKALEMAGKHDDPGYIHENHEAMMAEYRRVVDVIGKALYGDKDSEERNEDFANLREINVSELTQKADEFETGAYILDRNLMLSILTDLGNCSFNGKPLTKTMERIIHKVEMSDYMSAADALRNILGSGGE
ncbi:MAG: response regulator [Lachnospiraceae bacterium]|nr:response regulator [Lachnospiraceae bacterium]